jgi:hypothetical protein
MAHHTSTEIHEAQQTRLAFANLFPGTTPPDLATFIRILAAAGHADQNEDYPIELDEWASEDRDYTHALEELEASPQLTDLPYRDEGEEED